MHKKDVQVKNGLKFLFEGICKYEIHEMIQNKFNKERGFSFYFINIYIKSV